MTAFFASLVARAALVGGFLARLPGAGLFVGFLRWIPLSVWVAIIGCVAAYMAGRRDMDHRWKNRIAAIERANKAKTKQLQARAEQLERDNDAIRQKNDELANRLTSDNRTDVFPSDWLRGARGLR